MSLSGLVITSLAAVAAGLIIAAIATRLLKLTSGTAIAALILAPALVALLFSGQIREFKAFGIEAKFREAAAKPVSTDATALTSNKAATTIFDTGDILGADAPDLNLQQKALLAQAVHVVAIRASQWRELTPDKLMERAILVGIVIYHSLLAGSFQSLVVLDDGTRPLGVFEASYFLDLLRIPLDVPALPLDYEAFKQSPQAIRAKLLQTNLLVILSAPAKRAEAEANKAWISGRASRLEAMRLMVENRYAVLAVTDDRGRYSGIVSRDRLLLQVLLSGMEAATGR